MGELAGKSFEQIVQDNVNPGRAQSMAKEVWGHDRATSAMASYLTTHLPKEGMTPSTASLLTKAFGSVEEPEKLEDELNEKLKGSNIHVDYRHGLTYVGRVPAGISTDRDGHRSTAYMDCYHNLGSLSDSKTQSRTSNPSSMEAKSLARDVRNHTWNPNTYDIGPFFDPQSIARIRQAFEHSSDPRALQSAVNDQLRGANAKGERDFLFYRHSVNVSLHQENFTRQYTADFEK